MQEFQKLGVYSAGVPEARVGFSSHSSPLNHDSTPHIVVTHFLYIYFNFIYFITVCYDLQNMVAQVYIYIYIYILSERGLVYEF